MRALAFTLSAVLRWLLCVLCSVAVLLVSAPLCLVARRQAIRWVHSAARLQLRLLGVRLEIDDHNDGYAQPPYVFAYLNQTSLLDGFVLGALAPIPMRGIYNLGWVLFPPFGWVSFIVGGEVVLRGSPLQRRRALARAQQKLRAGHSYFLSIEGARFGQRDADGLLPYRTGAARLAISAGCPIVPIVLHGCSELLPLGTWRVRPGVVRVTICRPVPTAGLTEAEHRAAITQTLRDIARRELSAAPSPAAPASPIPRRSSL